MAKIIKHLFFLGLCVLGFSFNMAAQLRTIPPQNAAFSFTENKGQWEPDIIFKHQSASFHILLKNQNIAYYFLNENEVAAANEHLNKTKKKETIINGNYMAILFKNANKNCTPISVGEAESNYKNYYLANNKSKWKSHVRSYQNIIYPNIYNQIDLQIKTSKTNVLKYDWIIKPNADLKQINIELTGADSIYINYEELYISHSQGVIKEQKPFAYQIINGKRKIVDVKYILINNYISFEAENYNHNYNLIIDPDLIFSTYSGSTEDNFGFTATYDSEGSLYAAGITTNAFGGNYPVTPGSFQLSYKGGVNDEPVHLPCDITISKYSSNGKQLLYATYLGGNVNEYPHSLVADNNDNLVIMGTSKSANFPTTTNAYDTSFNGNADLIITKISKDGSSLLGSTFMGGSMNDGFNYNSSLNTFYADEFRGDVIIDKNNNIIVGSCSYSTNFPITAGSFGASISSPIQKGVVFKLTPNCSSLIFCSALPSNSQDVIYSVDLNNNDDIFIAGSTTNNILISTATNSYLGGNSDGFIAKIKNDGSTILKAKYIGTDLSDQIFSLEIDKAENIYVVGNSLGNIKPVGNVYSVANGKQFISKIDKDFNTILYTSTFGRGGNDVDISINAFLLDDCGRLYISGWGGKGLGGNTNSLPVTSDAIQKNTDGRDFYLIIMNENAEKIAYASFFGGNKTADHVDGGTSRFDKRGYIYQSVCASCPDGIGTISDFPTSSDAVFKTNVSPRCSNAAFKMSFKFKQAQINYTIDSCLETITFNTPTENAISYLWLFPNGKTSTIKNPTTTIKEINNNEITLILNNETACADTAKATINFNENLSHVNTANVFTPNNDGINDYFQFTGLLNCSEAVIKIYNRWGQEMYKSRQADFKWDGNAKNGEPAVEGIYFYVASFTKHNQPMVKLHGTVTLIRQ